MEITSRIRILATIKTGSVYYFEEDELSSDEPHYFVILNKNPLTEEFFILVCASSNVEKRRRIIRLLGLPQETLVFVSPSECSIFSRDTVIDCNRVFEKGSEALIKKLDENKLKICTEVMPCDILQKLIAGVSASPQISPKIKLMLPEDL